MSNALTGGELQAMHARACLATPGPWASYVEGRNHLAGADFIQTSGEDIQLIGGTVADQDFIAHARQDIPALLAEIDRLQRLVSHLEKQNVHPDQ